MLVVLAAPPCQAQIPGLPDIPRELSQVSISEALSTRETSPVKLNDRVLFRVGRSGEDTAKDRAEIVSLRLENVLKELESRPMPDVRFQMHGASIVILAGDRVLLTVTEQDGKSAGSSAPDLAREWARSIEVGLAAAYLEKRPDFLRHAFTRAAVWLIAGLLLHLLIWGVSRRFVERPPVPGFLLIWGIVALRLLDIFPQTRSIYVLLTEGVLRPLMIIATVLLVALVATRLWSAVLRRLFPPMPVNLPPEERTERTYRRRATLGAVTRITGVTILWFIALVTALSLSGVNLPALLASAGLIGVGIGLAAQDSMKDIVSGINILIDDRYGVGDVIEVGPYSGRVERLNLRITQVRDISGRLITFPNRNIETVANATSRWSQVDIIVGVDYNTDLRRAMQLMLDTARQLASEWQGRIIQEPEMLGVDAFRDSAIELRMIMRTAPGDQWSVGRELRLRIKDAFDAAGISIPFPQRTFHIATNTPVPLLNPVDDPPHQASQ